MRLTTAKRVTSSIAALLMIGLGGISRASPAAASTFLFRYYREACPWRARCGGDSHAGFGGRLAETERPRGRHRAAGRPYLGGKACDQVRRDEYNKHGRSSTDTGK